MRMTKLMILLLVFSLALISFNCSDDDEDAVIPERYIGTWEAKITLEGTLIEYAPEASPDQGVDVRALGAEIKATLNRDGSYTLTFVLPGEEPDTDAGTVSIDEEDNILVLNSNTDEDIIFEYAWEDDILVLMTLTDFDFTLQGNEPIPAIITIKLRETSP
jgi:hypothetical protein